MHIVVVSDTEHVGGAAVSTNRLLDGLCRVGGPPSHRITRIVAGADGKPHAWNTMKLVADGNWSRRVGRLLPPSLRRRWLRSYANTSLARLLADLQPDVINVHCLHLAHTLGWSSQLVDVCASKAPTVWTFHDMWAFTGRCIYSYDCDRFVDGCNAVCPTATEYPVIPVHRIAPEWQARHELLQRHPALVAVTPSRWLSAQTARGMWRHHRVETIPYGLPLEAFMPQERKTARAALGLPADGIVLLSAAQDINERRKGGRLLLEALESLLIPVTVLTMGNGSFDPANKLISVRHLGYIDDDVSKVHAYNAADAFVHPALVDNLPNVVLEAIACGTPVVGFQIGGVPDMVRPGETGWLAKDVSAEGLAMVLAQALADINSGIDLRASCRRVAQQEYDLQLQAERYLELFASVCR